MQKFLHNKSTAKVSLINGSILIEIGGKQPISPEQETHEDVVHARRSQWVKLGDEEEIVDVPEVSSGIKITEDPMKGSVTIPTVTPKETVTSSALGTSEEVKPVAEAEIEEVEKSAKAKKSKKTEEE